MTAPKLPAGWLPLAKTARELGVPTRTMLRRMTALNQKHGGNILRSYSAPGRPVRKWFVHPDALRANIDHDPTDIEVGLGEHLLRIQELEKKLQALRNSHIALKLKVKGLTERPN